MRLYKFDYKGTIGNNVITVPTDSQFIIGIGNGDATATARLFDGNTEILPEEYKIGEYTCFRFETNGTPFRKPYKAVIGDSEISLVVLCRKMSIAYRDLEGEGEGQSVTPEQIINTVSTSQRFLEKQNGVWDASSSPVLVDSATFQGNVVFTPANPNTQALTVQGRIIAIARSDGVAIDVSNGNVNLNQGKITFTNSGRTYELSPVRLTIDGQDYFVLATNPINS